MDNIKLKQLAAILLLAGLILAVLTLRAKPHMLDTPRVLEGHVVDRYTARTAKASEPELILRVEFDDDGNKHVIERSVEDRYWNAHAKGSNVEVELLGTDASQAKLVGASSERLVFWLKIGGGALAVILGLIVLGYDRWRTWPFPKPSPGGSGTRFALVLSSRTAQRLVPALRRDRRGCG